MSDRAPTSESNAGSAPGGGRSCGECRVCCKSPELPELGKPMDTWCPHVNPDRGSEAGCTVYGTSARPTVCADFKCGWLLGLGEEGDRPDKLGVLMQPTVRAENEPVLAFIEHRPGSLGSARAQALMEAWSAHIDGPVTIRRAGVQAFMRVPVTVNRVVVRPDPLGRPARPAARR